MSKKSGGGGGGIPNVNEKQSSFISEQNWFSLAIIF